MRNNSQSSGDGESVAPRSRVNNGIVPSSIKALSNYLKLVSSSASTVASTVRSAASAASAIVERDSDSNHEQVSWVQFDKVELERGTTRQILLLGFSYGFQIWDVEAADNVHNIVSRHDGYVSFMQVLPKPVASNEDADQFTDSRPLLVICADGSFSGDINGQEGSAVPCKGSIQQSNVSVNDAFVPTVVWFYSFRTQSYVHHLRFRTIVHLVRCSSRVVAVLQPDQIHFLNASSLKKEYIIRTNPVPIGLSGNIGVGPLALGPRWVAYSGSQVAIARARNVNAQHVTPSPSFPSHSSNGSLVRNFALESSKQLAAGIASLGDMGYKTLSRYYYELYPESNNFQSGGGRVSENGVSNGHSPAADDVGMVIVRDIVSREVIAQFKAHKSPILSLCFDPSGVLLVTASVQGHNINVFRVLPGLSEDSSGSHVHLYRLQRGLTNAVIQDISFSCDSQWIMISSLRGTSHLFAISLSGTKPAVYESLNSGLQVLNKQSLSPSSPPVNLNAVSRIRNGSNGWRNTVSGAAAAATGRSSSLSGAIASVFHYCKGDGTHGDQSSMKKNNYLLVFSPSGCVTQYVVHTAVDGMKVFPGTSLTSESCINHEARLMVEAMHKWNICQKQNGKDRGDNVDMYSENGNSDSSKVYPVILKHENCASTRKNEKITSQEERQMYISEVELQMHQSQNPLWSRSQICFQPMHGEINETDCGGEIEIERFPVHILEAKSKNLVPVFDHFQNHTFQFGRGQ